MMDNKRLKIELQKELARRDFFEYCHVMAPDFYRRSRSYLVELCGDFQEFLTSDDDVLIINEPPRHGKSRTAGMFIQWVLGNDQNKKIMTGSYNETLSTTFSKGVRNAIQELKADEERIVFSDIFPNVSIKLGDGAMNLWSLNGGFNNYLATSPTGTATGFGADLILIDDLIKSALEANNANVLQGHWDWFINTMLSRLETGGKIIIVMTRWHSSDLAGRALNEMEATGYKVKHISMKAYDEVSDTMLCEEVLSKAEYKRKVKTMGPDIASANYQQEPIDLKGKLYSSLKEYEVNDKPEVKMRIAYGDTADDGSDNLAIYFGDLTFNNDVYITDVYYTKDSMEITEPETARKAKENNTNFMLIESNSGGKGFARNVVTEMEKIGWSQTVVDWFHQSDNKKARIISNSTWVMEHVFFPKGWKNKHPKLYEALNTYQKEGKNAHDDGPDALTGIAEIAMGKRQQKKRRDKRQTAF